MCFLKYICNYQYFFAHGVDLNRLNDDDDDAAAAAAADDDDDDDDDDGWWMMVMTTMVCACGGRSSAVIWINVTYNIPSEVEVKKTGAGDELGKGEKICWKINNICSCCKI